MAASIAVKTALVLNGKKHKALIGRVSNSPQALSAKFQRDSWSDKDLIGVADVTGMRLAFVHPDGWMVEIK